MLYWRYSENRIFFLNEYWIFVPSAILANYLIIRQIRRNRAKKELKENLAQVQRVIKIRKILLLSLGLSGNRDRHLFTRGGSTDFRDIINTDYIREACKIEQGVRLLDDQRLKNIIVDLYRHKGKGQIIYVTATALCHIANQYGQTFLALPFAVGDFGLTSLYQTVRKVFVTLLLGAVGPLYVIGGPVSSIFALILGVSGLRLGFNNLDVILTSPVDVIKELKPRIPGTFDIVVLNNNDKIVLRNPVQENPECWLPDQHLLNTNCNVKPTEIPDAIDSVLPDLRYEDTVNMKDTTGLPRQEFSDQFDLGQTKQPRQGKEINFLEKFGDSGQISEGEGWDTRDNEFLVPEKRNLRTRN